MSFAATALLLVAHALYRLYRFVWHAWRSLVRRNVRVESIGPLSKTPKHLGVILAQRTDFQSPEHVEAMVETACRVAEWCAAMQIPNVSVYDRTGSLVSASRDVSDELLAERVEVERPQRLTVPREHFPLTPPPSNHSEATSRSLSPEPHRESIITLRCTSTANDTIREEPSGADLRRRHAASHASSDSPPFTVTLRLLSRDAGKPQLAEAAQRLAYMRSAQLGKKDAKSSTQEVDSLVFDMTGMPEVDLLIVHPLSGSSNWPLELHGFPPWQMRLAEIYHDAPRPFQFVAWWKGAVRPLSEDAFCRALRMFGRAEQRVGT